MVTTLDPPAIVPLEPTTPLRPSQAIALGRLTVPERLRGRLFRRRNDGYAACAMGAMAVGYGVDPSTMLGTLYYWPPKVPMYTMVRPLCGCDDNWVPARDFVSHTFDGHTMGVTGPYISEQQIIDHLASYGL